MSDQGWHDFLAADGVDDWVVLHGGATAVFRVPSLTEAARLAEAIAKAPGIAGAGVLLTLADTRVSVRLSRDIWNLEQSHIQLAQAVSAVAREHGAVPDRAAVQEVQVAIAAKRDEIDVGFWRAVLGLHPDGRRQCGRSTRTRIDGLDAGAQSGQAVAPCYAHRRVCRARAGQGADRCSRRCRRSYRRRVTCTSALDARRPRGQPRLYLRVAGWMIGSAVSQKYFRALILLYCGGRPL